MKTLTTIALAVGLIGSGLATPVCASTAVAAPALNLLEPVQTAQAGQAGSGAAQPAPSASGGLTAGLILYSLDELLKLARTEAPAVTVARASALATRAGITTARALPNPEIEFESGRLRARRIGAISGDASVFSVAQTIENPSFRTARVGAASARAAAADLGVASVATNVAAEVKIRFYELLEFEEQFSVFNEDLRLAEAILERVRVRTRTGESPRFDLVRAENEVAQVRKNVEATRLRVQQAKAALRERVGPAMSNNFDIRGNIESSRFLSAAEIQALREAAMQTNPDVALALAEEQAATRQIDVEQAAVLPGFGVRVSQGFEPEFRQTTFGAFVTIPLLNRREGPIQEAQALAARARAVVDQRQYETAARFEAALRSYEASASQVAALEGGIIERARATVDIAEAAYRFGERGILEFLDAQRQFRLVRNELIQARFELQFARIELERLAGR